MISIVSVYEVAIRAVGMKQLFESFERVKLLRIFSLFKYDFNICPEDKKKLIENFF